MKNHNIKIAILIVFIFTQNAKGINFSFTKIPDCENFHIKKNALKEKMCLKSDEVSRILHNGEHKNVHNPNEDQTLLIKKSIDKNSKNEIKFEEYDKISVKKYKKYIANIAKKNKVSSKTIRSFLKNVEYKPFVVKAESNQPEVKLSLVDYILRYLSPKKIHILNKKVPQINQELDDIFQNLEKKFGINRSTMMALWFAETQFGDIVGNEKIIDALFTTSFNSIKRKSFFEKNLVQYLQLVDSQYVKIDTRGSWAGAFGQVQFMPQTFKKYAISYEKAEKIDLFKPRDALASLSNYLYNLKWNRHEGILTQVEIPSSFDYCSIGYMSNKAKTIREWQNLGVKLHPSHFGKKYFEDKNKKAWLIIPDKIKILPNGCSPLVFLVYKNFARVLDWNKSQSFAIVIALLDDKINQILSLHKKD